ncbi:MAG: hypothetical protein JOY51_04305 [Nevskia sp.]|nr:hypothetical protein [Nevskia sp.]
MAALPVWAQDPDKGEIVCWQDEHGVRACGDHVPAQYAKKQRDVYSPRGVVIRTLKAEETPEQRAEAQRQAEEAAREQAQQQRQQLNDKYILQTYSSLDELKGARDGRLQTYDTRLELAQKAVDRGGATLQDLQDRADVERSAGRDPSPELQAQIKTYAAAQAENISAVARIKQDRDSTAAQFQHYIELYQQVHGGATPLPQLATPAAPETPQAPSPPPAPKP